MRSHLVRALSLLTAAALVSCESGTAPRPSASAAVFFDFHGDRHGTFAVFPTAVPDTIRGPFAAAFWAPSGELYLCAATPKGHGTSLLLLLNVGVVSGPTAVTLPLPSQPGIVPYAGGLIFTLSPDHSAGENFTLLQGQALISSVTVDSIVGEFAALFSTPSPALGTTAYATSTSGGRFAVPIVAPSVLPHICGT